MRSAFVLAVVIAQAGCGFQITTGGSSPDDARVDGPDSMVADGPIDMAIDMAPDMGIMPVDTDGDTIVDTLDNCPAIANTNQRNHDGDPFGDVCDKCPHLASTMDPDGDNDGVGDACDPRPNTAGDTRVLWVGFYDANDITGWSGQGTFTVVDVGGNGYLQQATANVSGFAPAGNVAKPFIMTELVIDNLINTNGSVGLAVNTPTNAQLECAVSKGGSNVSVRARVLGGGSQSTNWPGTFAVGSRIALRFDMSDDVDCRAIQGANNVQQVQFTSITPNGRTFVGTEGIAARFDYLFVVDVGS